MFASFSSSRATFAGHHAHGLTLPPLDSFSPCSPFPATQQLHQLTKLATLPIQITKALVHKTRASFNPITTTFLSSIFKPNSTQTCAQSQTITNP
jgi:hypothetical protein